MCVPIWASATWQSNFTLFYLCLSDIQKLNNYYLADTGYGYGAYCLLYNSAIIESGETFPFVLAVGGRSQS
jgi:hypothetical protein